MLYLVFDLDDTLYQIPYFDYELIKKNMKLKKLLDLLPFKKIIFTNGTYGHAIKTLDLIGIRECFDIIEARDTLGDMKPKMTCFNKFISKTKINKSKDHVIFFEDNLSNLGVAKMYNWLTFYIGSDDHSFLPFVDICFQNIEDSLKFIKKKHLQCQKVRN